MDARYRGRHVPDSSYQQWRRSRLPLAFAVIGGLIVAAALVATANDERAKLVVGDSYGRITSGSKLGVSVGERWETADSTIRHLFQPSYVLWEPSYVRRNGRIVESSRGKPVLQGVASVSYRDPSWRNGVVTLDLIDGRVVRITWHYPGPFYIDL